MDVQNADAVRQFEDEEQPPEQCNTGGSFRFPTDFEKTEGGLDWLDLSVYGFWSPADFEALNEKLGRLRKDAEAGGEAVYVAPDGDQLAVMPYGMPGVARWVLAWDGCTLAIAARAEESETALSVFVHIGSMKLMQDGDEKAVADCRGILSSMGFTETRNVVSRADLCTDLPNVDCREFVRALMADRAICKASKGCMYWKGVPGVESSTGFDLGTETKLRVYNKLVEVAKNPAKWAIIAARRWGENVSTATRVEYQLRRDSLNKNWGVSSYEDFKEKLPSIAEWLTQKWFRLADDFDRKNRNHDSAVTSSIWKNVQEMFARVFSGDRVQKPMRRSWVPSIESMQKQSGGCLSTLMAAGNAAVETADDVLLQMLDVLEPMAAQILVAVKRKAVKFALSAAVPVERWSVFDDWNGDGVDKVGTNAKEERRASWRERLKELHARREAKRGAFLFERGLSEVEASF